MSVSLIQGGPQAAVAVPAEVAVLSPDLRNAQKGALKAVPKAEASAQYAKNKATMQRDGDDARGQRVDIDA